jgi:hypothetical protein
MESSMKISALVGLKEGAAMDQVRTELAAELHGSWKLYLADVIREAYLTESVSRVVFVLEAADVVAARAELMKLPLVARGFFDLDLHALRPFANWALVQSPAHG